MSVAKKILTKKDIEALEKGDVLSVYPEKKQASPTHKLTKEQLEVLKETTLCELPKSTSFFLETGVTNEAWADDINTHIRPRVIKLMAYHLTPEDKLDVSTISELFWRFPLGEEYMDPHGNHLSDETKKFQSSLVHVLRFQLTVTKAKETGARFSQLAFWLKKVSDMEGEDCLYYLCDFWLRHGCWWTLLFNQSATNVLRIKSIFAEFQEVGMSIQEILNTKPARYCLTERCLEDMDRLVKDDPDKAPLSMLEYAEKTKHKNALRFFQSLSK